MTTIPITTPVRMGKATLTIATDDVTAPVSGAVFTSTQAAAWKGIGGNHIPATPEWSLDITAVQDTGPTGLMRYLFDHHDEEKLVTLTPEAGGPAITATVALGVPNRIGGTAGSTAPEEFTSTCPVNGAPEFDDTPGA